MSQCPYEETNTNRMSGKTETNPIYVAWHEGYEAHKLDLMANVKYIQRSMRELIAEARKIKELKKELEKQRTDF
jgi:hypothetical protein